MKNLSHTESSYERLTVGQLRAPQYDCESASNIPLGHVPGLTWSLSNECLYDIEFDDQPLTLSASIKDGIFIAHLSISPRINIVTPNILDKIDCQKLRGHFRGMVIRLCTY